MQALYVAYARVCSSEAVYVIAHMIFVVVASLVNVALATTAEALATKLHGEVTWPYMKVWDFCYTFLHMPQQRFWFGLPDLFVMALSALLIVLWIRLYFVEIAALKRSICVFARTYGICMLLRGTCVIATIHLPSPRCMEQNSGGLLMNLGCYDMLFSGHTTLSVCVALTCTYSACLPETPQEAQPGRKPHVPRPLLCLLWLLACGSVLCNLVSGDHYTVDILVASYLSFFVFKYCHSSVPYFPLVPFRDIASVNGGGRLLLIEPDPALCFAATSPDASPRCQDHTMPSALVDDDGQELHTISLHEEGLEQA